MSVTPWNQIDPNISPFVNLFSQAGIAAAAIIMNLVVLSSVMSSMNSGVFSTSRVRACASGSSRHRVRNNHSRGMRAVEWAADIA